LIAHTADANHGVIINEIPLNEKKSIRETIIIDELNTVFIIAIDLISTNKTIEPRTAVGLQTNFNTIIIVVTDDVFLNNNIDIIIQINAVIAVILKNIKLADAPTATFIINTVRAIDNLTMMVTLSK
jgi:hypothetical protein